MSEHLSPSATLERVTTDADTAAAWGAEFPPAASTPFILGLAEVACHRAMESELAAGEITVGSRAVIEHLAPSPVGATLAATARLVDRDGRRLSFDVEVHDGDVLVARIEHGRAIVDGARIVERLTQR